MKGFTPSNGASVTRANQNKRPPRQPQNLPAAPGRPPDTNNTQGEEKPSEGQPASQPARARDMHPPHKWLLKVATQGNDSWRLPTDTPAQGCLGGWSLPANVPVPKATVATKQTHPARPLPPTAANLSLATGSTGSSPSSASIPASTQPKHTAYADEPADDRSRRRARCSPAPTGTTAEEHRLRRRARR